MKESVRNRVDRRLHKRDVLEEGERVVAAVWGLSSWRALALSALAYLFFGRSAVVTDRNIYVLNGRERVLVKHRIGTVPVVIFGTPDGKRPRRLRVGSEHAFAIYPQCRKDAEELVRLASPAAVDGDDRGA